jgi:hypothetical protein
MPSPSNGTDPAGRFGDHGLDPDRGSCLACGSEDPPFLDTGVCLLCASEELGYQRAMSSLRQPLLELDMLVRQLRAALGDV